VINYLLSSNTRIPLVQWKKTQKKNNYLGTVGCLNDEVYVIQAPVCSCLYNQSQPFISTILKHRIHLQGREKYRDNCRKSGEKVSMNK
jgi:hypothetical protein